MSDTPKTDREALWAESTTGEDFKCVHIDDAREMERLLSRAIDILRIYDNNDIHMIGADKLIFDIETYLNS